MTFQILKAIVIDTMAEKPLWMTDEFWSETSKSFGKKLASTWMTDEHWSDVSLDFICLSLVHHDWFTFNLLGIEILDAPPVSSFCLTPPHWNMFVF